MKQRQVFKNIYVDIHIDMDIHLLLYTSVRNVLILRM